MVLQEHRVCLESREQRAREDRMGPRVQLALSDHHLHSVNQENLVPGAFLALRDPLDHQVKNLTSHHVTSCSRDKLRNHIFTSAQGFLEKKVNLVKEGPQVLAFKVLMVNQAHQVSQGTLVPRAPLAPLGIQDHRGLKARKVSSSANPDVFPCCLTTQYHSTMFQV